ncbi:thiol:disulfide interchange protein DsbA/DsbL [Xanthomonadaceae bacterium JHOS43]|nr:thiol:disulfide interchange protein DsbA/DsbL [Xanthomonadaceae bacterium JHOS43]
MNRAHTFTLRALAMSALMTLVACSAESPAPAPTTAPSPPAITAETVPAVPAPEPVPAPVADTGVSTPADNEPVASDDEAPTQPPPADTAPETKVASPVAPEGPEPRLGTDYQIIDPPQLLAAVPGKVEIAEVFSYTCIHCARLETLTPAWKKTLPAEVNFVYAPMSHGAFEPIARAFYAAQAMGVLDKTHSGMFKALAEQQKLGRGRIEDLASLYAELGVDGEALKATAASFAVNTQITRSQRTLARWSIEGTPTLVVAGKYRVVTTGDRGHEGMLQTARWLAQREIAEGAGSH